MDLIQMANMKHKSNTLKETSSSWLKLTTQAQALCLSNSNFLFLYHSLYNYYFYKTINPDFTISMKVEA